MLIKTLPAELEAKIRSALRNGITPLDIARKFGVPLLLIAEVAITLQQAQVQVSV